MAALPAPPLGLMHNTKLSVEAMGLVWKCSEGIHPETSLPCAEAPLPQS